jgi:hypothetical protein
MAMLKTGYPLLALSMETMVDQIQLKFKPQADEDMYRLVAALYHEGAQVINSCALFQTPPYDPGTNFFFTFVLAITIKIDKPE